MADYQDQVAEHIGSLTGFLLSDEGLAETLGRVAHLAVLTIAGCDGADVTLITDGEPRTEAATEPSLSTIDAVQYESPDGGPCIDAYERTRVNRIDSTATDPRWRRFCNAAAEHGVASVLSLPLVVRDSSIGALNLYSHQEAGFDDSDERVADLFADQAAVGLANAQTHESAVVLSQNLAIALESRAVIDQAKGILMARGVGTSQDAFDELRRRSQHENKKLRDVAQQIADETVAGAGDGAGT